MQPPGLASLSSRSDAISKAISGACGRSMRQFAFPLRGVRMQAGSPGGPEGDKGQGKMPDGSNLPVGWRGPAYGEPEMPPQPKLNKAQEMMLRGIIEKCVPPPAPHIPNPKPRNPKR